MGFSVGAYVPVLNDKGELRMRRYDGENPFSGTKYVGAEDFMEALRAHSNEVYFWDYMQPYWYYQPAEYGEIRMKVRAFEANVELFLGWLDWLKAHPQVWLEGSH